MMNDGVAPIGDERTNDKPMTYGPKMGGVNEKSGFYLFRKGDAPQFLGNKVDLVELLDKQMEKENN
jgi:hypothetical protein